MSTDSNVILKMQKISKAFAGVQALKDVDFELFKGEVHALMGENGAGKSTLMKALVGVHQPDSGTILYKGQEVSFNSLLEAQRQGISIIFQELNLIPHLSIAENIFFGREPMKHGIIDKKIMERESIRLLQLIGSDLDPWTTINRLTVSQQQMVEIAKALSFEVEILIMDEPTSALTEHEIDRLFEIVNMLKKKGVGIVYISHRMEELTRICDRVTIFRDGCYISTHELFEITMPEIIGKMVGRPLDKHFPEPTRQPSDELVMEVTNIERTGVFEPVSFNLRRGEILGITGLVGAKRTEMVRAIFGADTASGGEVIIRGKRQHIKNPIAAIKAGLAYLSEDRKLFGVAVRMTVRENTTMTAMEKVLSPWRTILNRKEQAAAQKYIDALAIKTPSTEQLVNNLSGGNQQKVVIGKWLFREAKVMIFDEPTRGIDVGAKYAIYQLLDQLAKEGIGVIMISSELPEVLGMSDRVLVMCQGRMTAMLEASKTNQEEIMSYATGIQDMYRSNN